MAKQKKSHSDSHNVIPTNFHIEQTNRILPASAKEKQSPYLVRQARKVQSHTVKHQPT